MSSRAERRKKAYNKFHKTLDIARIKFPTMTEEWRQTWARKHFNNPQSCSCHMCCNPRKLGAITKQEKIASLRQKDI